MSIGFSYLALMSEGASMRDFQQVYLDLGQGVHLSVIQGDGTMGKLSRGTVEVCLVKANGGGLIGEPGGGLDGPQLVQFIASYLQDRAVGWEYQ